MDEHQADTMSAAETLYWAEFFAWTMLVMTPIIWWLQGPSVSTDQFLVRTSLLLISGMAAIALRIFALWRRRGIPDSCKSATESEQSVQPTTEA